MLWGVTQQRRSLLFTATAVSLLVAPEIVRELELPLKYETRAERIISGICIELTVKGGNCS
jgi:hypothetical protein